MAADEIRVKTRALEKAINDLIATFEKETKCEAVVRQVDLVDRKKIMVQAVVVA